jgi:hypothetical protein
MPRPALPLVRLALLGAGALFFMSSPSARAEVELPRAIPTAKVVQQVGLTEIAVDYDRPAVKNRKIWGVTVPYSGVWTIGSNPAAKIKFAKDVTIGDKLVPAGTYWLLALPGKTSWTWVINKSPDLVASSRDYKPELDVVRFKATPKPAPFRERLTFSFSDLSDERTTLELQWESLLVPLPIQVNTTAQVLKAINDLDGTWRSFANAARYMLETKKDYDAGLKYVDEALALRDDWYCMWVKGALLAGKGDFAAAREWGEKARELERRSDEGKALAPDLDKAIAEWTRRSGGREKEAHALSKVGDSAPPPLAGGATAPPPAFMPAVESAPPPSVPRDDPPPSVRRARLRKR